MSVLFVRNKNGTFSPVSGGGIVTSEQVDRSLEYYFSKHPVEGTGTVKSVNGVSPDGSGNVELVIPNADDTFCVNFKRIGFKEATYSADKTRQEVYEAHRSGKTVYCTVPVGGLSYNVPLAYQYFGIFNFEGVCNGKNVRVKYSYDDSVSPMVDNIITVEEVALSTGGAGENALYVHVTEDENGTVTADKTNAEIWNAILENRAVSCVYTAPDMGTFYVPLVSAHEDGADFSLTLKFDNFEYSFGISITSDGTTVIKDVKPIYDGNVDLTGVVKSVNGVTPDASGNVDITIPSGTATAIDYDQNVHSVNHRGYSSSAPENTIPAYILSKQMGFTYVEADVSFTSDGVAVLLHDATIDRTSNGSGNISAMTYAEASKYDYGSWKNTKYTGTRIPTFEEFIILCKRIGLHPYIELKQNGSYTETQIQALVGIVKNCGMDGKVTWISFSADYLRYVKTADNSARLGYLTSSVGPGSVSIVQGLQTDTNEVFIDSADYDADAISLCQTAGIPLEIWTINSPSTIQNMNAYITGVTSDNLIAGKILYDAGMVYEYGIDEPVVPDEPDNPEPDGDEWNKVHFTEVEGYYNTSGVLTPYNNVYNTGILGVGTATKIQFTLSNTGPHYVVFFDSSQNVILSSNYTSAGTHVVDIPGNAGFFTVAYYENERDTFNLSANGVIGNTNATLTSISAIYSGGSVAVGTNVTALTGVVVTAHYSDGSTETVTGYTLSGTIAEGSNTVTVSYGGATATFVVTGVAESGGEESSGMIIPIDEFVVKGIFGTYPYTQGNDARLSYVGTGVPVTAGTTYVVTPVYSVTNPDLKYGVHYSARTVVDAQGGLSGANHFDSGWQTSQTYEVTPSYDAYIWICFANTSGSGAVDATKIVRVTVKEK